LSLQEGNGFFVTKENNSIIRAKNIECWHMEFRINRYF
jgi:hypothetical protein